MPCDENIGGPGDHRPRLRCDVGKLQPDVNRKGDRAFSAHCGDVSRPEVV